MKIATKKMSYEEVLKLSIKIRGSLSFGWLPLSA